MSNYFQASAYDFKCGNGSRVVFKRLCGGSRKSRAVYLNYLQF